MGSNSQSSSRDEDAVCSCSGSHFCCRGRPLLRLRLRNWLRSLLQRNWLRSLLRRLRWLPWGLQVLRYYGKREAEPTAVAEAEADPYYGSYGYGGYGLSYGRTYSGYGLSYGRRYGGYGPSYGGLYSRGYYGKREAEAEADPTFRKRRKNKRRPSYRRSYGHSHSYSYEPTYTRS